jgi:molybdopterin-guanine dinucleotide biosynthesis protein A
MTTHPFAALLLAGGRSERMGQDKALLKWQGLSLWRFQLNKLLALNPDRVILSCRADQQDHFDLADSKAEYFFDPPDFQLGPLGIIDLVLRVVEMPLIVMAVDMPCMTAEFMHQEFLASQNLNRGHCFLSASGLEPLAALYVPAMLPMMETAVKDGQLSLQKLFSRGHDLGFVDLQIAKNHQQHFFSNCNTPSEWVYEKSRSKRPA